MVRFRAASEMAGGIVQRAHGCLGGSEHVFSASELNVVVIYVGHTVAAKQRGALGRDVYRRGYPGLRAQGKAWVGGWYGGP